MPKVITFLSKDTIKNLKDLCKNSGKSLSKITSELVDAGYQINQHQETSEQNMHNEKNIDLTLKHSEYLLRILNITSEILRKIHDEPSKLPDKTVDLMLSEIKNYAKNIVETKIRNI